MASARLLAPRNPFLFGCLFVLVLFAFLRWLCTADLPMNTVCFKQHPDGSYYDACYCEHFSDHLFKQTVNSWSNLGFITVGLCILFFVSTTTHTSSRNRFTQDPVYPTAYGFLAVYLGPGSIAMHGSFTWIGGLIDSTSMYFWISFVIAYNFVRAYGLSRCAGVCIYLLAVLVASLTQGLFGTAVEWVGTAVFATLVVLGLATEILVLCRRKEVMNWKWDQWFVWGLAAFLIAFFVWTMSKTGQPWCFPDSVWQGHAFWHLMSSVAVANFFVYFWLAPDA